MARGRVAGVGISIHAPRTGSDSSRNRIFCPSSHFNPRSPHGERPDDAASAQANLAISIHAPRTGSDVFFLVDCSVVVISIHAPRTGSDLEGAARLQDGAISIHAPRTGATLVVLHHFSKRVISIHAPRTGSDNGARHAQAAACHFNPRSPHGERPVHLFR